MAHLGGLDSHVVELCLNGLLPHCAKSSSNFRLGKLALEVQIVVLRVGRLLHFVKLTAIATKVTSFVDLVGIVSSLGLVVWSICEGHVALKVPHRIHEGCLLDTTRFIQFEHPLDPLRLQIGFKTLISEECADARLRGGLGFF